MMKANIYIYNLLHKRVTSADVFIFTSLFFIQKVKAHEINEVSLLTIALYHLLLVMRLHLLTVYTYFFLKLGGIACCFFLAS